MHNARDNISGQFAKSHGCSRTENKRLLATYRTWAAMKARCLNPDHPSYDDYGGRGITICDRWLDPQNFIDDMGEKPIGLSLERKDNDGPYSPDNCKWATRSEQMNNRRANRIIEFNGQTMTMTQWARQLGIHHRTLWHRLRKQPIEKALTPGLQPKGGDWKKKRREALCHQ